MTLNNEQYERIARWLDGEMVSLTDEESAAAGEVRSGEARLRTALGAEAVPHRAMASARRTLRAATGRRVVLRARFIGAFAAGAAIAAALFITLVLRHAGPPNTPVGETPGREVAKADVPVDVWLGALEAPPGGVAINLLCGEMDQFEAELAESKPPGAMDRQIDTMQQDIDQFWTEDGSSETPEM
jgi:hypothetical protein